MSKPAHRHSENEDATDAETRTMCPDARGVSDAGHR